MSRKFLFLLFIFIGANARAQYSVEGIVMNADKQALAFVNIGIEGSKENTSTNIDGKFKLNIPGPGTVIVFSYVGYRQYLHAARGTEKDLVISLEKHSYELGQVEVTPGENPAHRIIKLAIKNRDQNDPGKISSYICNTYSKTYYDFISNDDELKTRRDSIESDSMKAGFKMFSESSHVMMLESVTERKYLHPGNLNEKVLATRVSGFKDPSFSTSATDLQPFSFYEDYFKVLNKQYLNPISFGSTSRYFFNIEDTLYQEMDTVFIIYFRPAKGKTFDGLEGLLYINTHGYAIQNVIVSPHDDALVDLKIQQQYRLVDGKQWFPEQLNYELHYKKFPSRLMGMKLTGKGYVTDVKLEADLERKDFSYISIAMEPDATRKDEQFWKKYRVDTLNAREKRTYVLIDSLGKEIHLDRTLKILEALTSFQLPVSVFNIDLNRIFSMNEYETVRLGIGLHTNDRLSKWFSLGGYIGYGYADSVPKYGGDLKIFMKKDSREYYLKYLYSKDLLEPGKSQYFYTRNNINRNVITWRMDFMEQHELSLNARLFKHFVLNFSVNKHIRKPHYNYIFLPNAADLTEVSTEFRSTEFRLKGRFAFKEKLVKSFGQLLSEGSEFPVVHFAYTHGFKTPEMGYYEYDKISIGIEKEFTIRNIGRSRFLLEGGYVEGKVPYPYLFHGNGSYNMGGYLYVENTFQTMGLYEFVSDKYVNLFYSHKFSSALFKRPNSQPKLSLHTNVAYGELVDPAPHRNRYFGSMDKGYLESGFFLNDLLRANYFNVAYLGLGGGVFMRYGPYMYRNTMENFAYKISLNLSF